jgi:hypothetical protein
VTGEATRGLRSWRATVIRLLTPLHLREALVCAPAIPLLLISGFAAGRPIPGAIAAGAAFSVGFGAVRELRGHRWGAMAAAALAMSLAAFVGSIAGQWTPSLVAAAAIGAGYCAWLALREETLWWVALQSAIALIVAGHYPGPVEVALSRAVIILAGGAVQMVLVSLLRLIVPRLPPLGQAAPRPPPAPARTRSHVIRATLAVGVCAAIAHGLRLPNYYWAPMTALLVLKPGLSETRVRGLHRLAGTLAGCVTGGTLAVALGDAHPAIFAALAVSVAVTYALQKAAYAMFTVAVTTSMVLLLSLVGGGALATALHRLVATAVGGGVALVAAQITRHPRPAVDPAADRIAD